jgi:pimeloyl-ACP methyl ester carboxylesterase
VRAREPDVAGSVERDGVRLAYEVFGDPTTSDGPTILLMPTWTLIHARFWKMQVPYLARHFPVVVYDGPGNGGSDRVTDRARYSPHAYAADAAAVLDACGVRHAVAVGVSRGAWYAIELAALRPAMIAGLVLVGSALPVAPALPQRAQIAERFLDPAPEVPEGWDRYNLAYWHAHYEEFAEWFFGQVFTEPHSTKGVEDAVGWALEGGPAMLEAESMQPGPRRPVAELLSELTCPTLVVHGQDDAIQSHAIGVEVARLSNGTLVTFEGSGHMPNVRDPVRFNHLVRQFVAACSNGVAV